MIGASSSKQDAGRRVLLLDHERDELRAPQTEVLQKEYYEDRANAAYFRENEPEHNERHHSGLVCGIDPAAMGYLVCFLVLVEGVILVFHATGVIDHRNSMFSGLSNNNPFAGIQWTLLGVFGFGDIITAVLAGFGIWLSLRAMPVNWTKSVGFHEYHAGSAQLFVGVFLIFRALATLFVGPWVGIMLAFEPSDFDKVPYLFWTMFYLAFSIFTLWALVQVYRFVVAESERVQEELNREVATRRQLYISMASKGHHRLFEDGEQLFYCLPLELTLGVYAIVAALAFLVFFIQHVATGKTIGAWAFLLPSTPVDMTWWIEFVVYSVSFAFAMAALGGIIGHNTALEQKEGAIQEGQSGGAYYNEELADAMRMERRSIFAVLIFFIFSLLRIAFFIPITGMTLITRDTCGIYVYALSSISVSRPGGSAPLHCSGSDFFALLVVLGFVAFDAYMTWGYLRLWREYREQLYAGSSIGPGKSFGTESYGSTTAGASYPSGAWSSSAFRPSQPAVVKQIVM